MKFGPTYRVASRRHRNEMTIRDYHCDRKADTLYTMEAAQANKHV